MKPAPCLSALLLRRESRRPQPSSGSRKHSGFPWTSNWWCYKPPYAIAEVTRCEARQQDFEVFEDGRPQPIRLFRHEDTPVTVGLVIDHSGSMREKLEDVTAAGPRLRPFQQFQRSDVRRELQRDVFRWDCPSGCASAIAPSNWETRSGRRTAIGTTALYDAIIEALERLQKGTSDKKVLIVISDGGDNASKARLDQVLKMAEQSNAMIYTIGIFDPDDPDKNPRVLSRLAQESGGEAFFPHQLSETVQICEHIARDIRDQYTIGYVSTKKRMARTTRFG